MAVASRLALAQTAPLLVARATLLVPALLPLTLLHPLVGRTVPLLALGPVVLALLVSAFVRGHLVHTVTALVVTLLLGTLVLRPSMLGPLLTSRLAVRDLAALVMVPALSGLAVTLSLSAVGLSTLAESVVLPLLLLVTLAGLVLVAALVCLTLMTIAVQVVDVLAMAFAGLFCELVVAEHLIDLSPLVALALLVVSSLVVLMPLVLTLLVMAVLGLPGLVALASLSLVRLMMALSLPAVPVEQALTLVRLLPLVLASLLMVPRLVSAALCAGGRVALPVLALERVLVVLSLVVFSTLALVVGWISVHRDCEFGCILSPGVTRDRCALSSRRRRRWRTATAWRVSLSIQALGPAPYCYRPLRPNPLTSIVFPVTLASCGRVELGLIRVSSAFARSFTRRRVVPPLSGETTRARRPSITLPYPVTAEPVTAPV